LAIHTRPEHAQRVQDCINSSDLMLQAARYGRLLGEHAPSAGQSLLLLGGIATTAVALVYAFSRNRQRWLNDTGTSIAAGIAPTVSPIHATRIERRRGISVSAPVKGSALPGYHPNASATALNNKAALRGGLPLLTFSEACFGIDARNPPHTSHTRVIIRT
jgi:hypothetical protein